MDKKEIGGLVSVVSSLGWRRQLREVLGDQIDTFYDTLVAQNPEKAYAVAQRSNDPLFLQAVTERIIQSNVGGTELEATIHDMYLKPAPVTPVVPESALVALRQSTGTPIIEEFETVYRMHTVFCFGEKWYVDVEKELEDGGNAYQQTVWSEKSKKVASAPLYVAVMSALEQNKEHPDDVQRARVDKVRKMLAKDFRNFGMMTSTRVRYASAGLDTVVHNFSYENSCEERATLVGPDGYIKQQSGFDGAMKALVGIADCNEVKRVVEYITGKKPYLRRFNINTKHHQDVERALVLGGDGGFNIIAIDNCYRRVRGMVAHRAETP